MSTMTDEQYIKYCVHLVGTGAAENRECFQSERVVATLQAELQRYKDAVESHNKKYSCVCGPNWVRHHGHVFDCLERFRITIDSEPANHERLSRMRHTSRGGGRGGGKALLNSLLPKG